MTRSTETKRPAEAAAGLGAAIVLVVLATSANATGPDWTASWASLLEQHTRSVESTVGTTVDYRALRAGTVATDWRTLLAGLADAPKPVGRERTVAFWIDAYNILAVDTVLRAWPVDSIRDAGNLLWPVWKKDAGVVGGRQVSLHEIEHEILRPLGDPRIHAAIVCASTSCPSLRRTTFAGGDLDAKLDASMRSWLASPTKGLRIDRSRRRITVSKIFDWFEEDFDALGGVPAVLIRFAPEDDREWLAQNAAGSALDYFDYDWTLNDWNRTQAATTLVAP